MEGIVMKVTDRMKNNPRKYAKLMRVGDNIDIFIRRVNKVSDIYRLIYVSSRGIIQYGDQERGKYNNYYGYTLLEPHEKNIVGGELL